MKDETKETLTTLCVVGIVLLLIFLLCYVAYRYVQSKDELCEKVCLRKGMEFVDEWGSQWQCKCIDENGDFSYFEDG